MIPNVPLGKEPVAIIAAAVSILQLVQGLAITGISSGAHAVIAVVLVVLGAILARNSTTPVLAAPAAAPVPPPAT